MEVLNECLICAFPFDDKDRLYSYGVCGHEGLFQSILFNVNISFNMF